MKTVVLYVSALLIFVAAVILIVNYSTPNVYYGTDLRFSLDSDNTLVIENVASVNFEATSSEFYAMHQGEDAVIGKSSIPPAGWKSRNYFATPPTAISAGFWTVDDGDYAVHLHSDEDMKVIVGQTTYEVVDYTIVMMFFALLLWGLIYIAILFLEL